MSAPMGTNYRLEDMSGRINISSRTLRKKLHDEGTSYRCIVNEMRISTAKAYLKSSSLSIQEIAYMVGYEHSPNFFRAFRKEVGITPDQYRAQSSST
jgi:AraC-like DNA-binding protein